MVSLLSANEVKCYTIRAVLSVFLKFYAKKGFRFTDSDMRLNCNYQSLKKENLGFDTYTVSQRFGNPKPITLSF